MFRINRSQTPRFRLARAAAISAVVACSLSGLFTSASSAAYVPPRVPIVDASPGDRCSATPTTGERTVHSPQELDCVLRLEPQFKGRIVIPKDVSWDMTGYKEMPLRSGVQIVGQRGDLASRPTLYTNLGGDEGGEYSFFVVTGNDVRVEGLHLRGPKPATDRHTETYVTGIWVVEDADNRTGRNVVIADNEMEQWSGACVETAGTHGNITLAQFNEGSKNAPKRWEHLTQHDAGLVRVERNYMHHNVMDNGGYGVDVSGGSYVWVEGNVFDTNRHSVASTGRAYSGYVARFNLVLQGGYKQDSYYNQHFDVHGETDSGDNKGYGGNAGTYFEIAFNTVRGRQSYGLKNRPVLMLRGKPTEGLYFHDNVVVHEDADEAISLKMNKHDLGVIEDDDDFNYHGYGNHYDTDHTQEIAQGDFDGDTLQDVFLATGTAWYISRAGKRPWELLHESTKLRSELGFADVDNDGVTDVLYRNSAGSVGYLRSGKENLRPLFYSPVALKDMRFGDFDGDAKTDAFYTRNGQWHVWYGKTKSWASTQTSSVSINEMLFGEFDNVRGTDIVTPQNAGWMMSSASTGSWTKINERLSSTFANMVAGDFNGNGRADIAYGTQKKWFVSYDGRAPFTILRDGNIGPASLKGVLIGRFDFRRHGAQVVSWSAVTNPLQLNGWQGQGSTNCFCQRTEQAMR